jgi:hypothetical protein
MGGPAREVSVGEVGGFSLFVATAALAAAPTRALSRLPGHGTLATGFAVASLGCHAIRRNADAASRTCGDPRPDSRFVSTWALLIPALAVAAVASYAGLAAAAIRPHHQEPHPYRLRLLAGVMHAIQPFVRAWGRITTRPLQPLQRSTHPWTGDRAMWLLELERELARGRGAVRLSSPSDSWDLSVSVGPLMSYRITTAVVRHWQPMWPGRVVPRVTFLLAMIAAWGDRPGSAIGRSPARSARSRSSGSVVSSPESSRGNCGD